MLIEMHFKFPGGKKTRDLKFTVMGTAIQSSFMYTISLKIKIIERKKIEEFVAQLFHCRI